MGRNRGQRIHMRGNHGGVAAGAVAAVLLAGAGVSANPAGANEAVESQPFVPGTGSASSEVGRISLRSSGTAVSIGIGAMLSSALLLKLGINMWLGMLISAAISGALGAIIAWIDFRFQLGHLSFVLITLAAFVLTFLGATILNILAGEPFTATQILWSGGRVGAGLAAARNARGAARATRDESLADLALLVQSAYLEAVYAQAVQAIAEDALAQANAHLEQVTLFRKQGSRSEYDLLQAQVDAANQEPETVGARNAATQSLLQLRRLLDLPLDRPLVLLTPLAFAGGEVPVLTAPSADGAARPALAGAEDMVRARREALRFEKAGRWPSLLASATVSHQAYPTDWAPTRRDFVAAVDGSVKLQWPLFQGFRTFGTVQRASAELRQAEAERDRARKTVALQVEQSRQEVQRALATLVARRGTAALAQRAHHLATVRWRNGLSTQLEVSDARLRMQTAEVNEVAAVKDYRLALLQLERVTGRPLPLENRSLDALSPTPSTEGAH